MSSNEIEQPSPETTPLRRRGDRRVQDQDVANDRRKGDRRDLPGVTALFRTLFRRGTNPDS